MQPLLICRDNSSPSKILPLSKGEYPGGGRKCVKRGRMPLIYAMSSVRYRKAIPFFLIAMLPLYPFGNKEKGRGKSFQKKRVGVW